MSVYEGVWMCECVCVRECGGGEERVASSKVTKGKIIYQLETNLFTLKYTFSSESAKVSPLCP